MESVHGPGSAGSHGIAARRPSPAVYRRRRLVAAVLALLLVGLLVAGVVMLAGLFSRDDGDPAAGRIATTPTTTPTDPPDAVPPSPVPSSPVPPAEPSAVPSATPSGEPEPAPSGREPSAGDEAEPSTGDEAEPSTDGEAAEPECDPADIVVEAETDAAAYAPGQEPVLSLVVRNESDVACAVNVGTSQMEFLVADPTARIFSSADCQQAPEDLERVLEPGAEEVATLAWERTSTAPGCEAVEPVPEDGTYALTTRLGNLTSATTSFVLDG